MNRNYGSPQAGGSAPGPKSRLNHASVLRRIGAYLIDYILLSIVAGIFTGAMLASGAIQFPLDNIEDISLWGIYLTTFFLVNFGFVVLLYLAYFTYFESENGEGATLGKRLLDLKVVNEYGKEIDTGKSFLRNLARLLWFIPFVSWVFWLIDVFLVADKNQRIGDMIADSYVAKEEYGSIYQTRYGTPTGKPEQTQGFGGYDRGYQTSEPPQQRSEQPPPPPPPEEEKNCKNCGCKMRYIREYDRWYCDNCQKYE